MGDHEVIPIKGLSDPRIAEQRERGVVHGLTVHEVLTINDLAVRAVGDVERVA